jgi:hypothetical protein
MAKTDAVARPTAFEEPSGRLPTAPNVPASFLLVQFWRDIFGKEVQSAATYSYLWMADQMGHVALGIILQFALTFVLQYFFGLWDALASGLALLGISGVVSFWEYRAYSVAAADADKGIFPLDRTLLRDNAVIAAAYMIFGVLAGYAFHLTGWWGALIFLIAMALSIYYAPYWLRQKIIWQKAALPYLSRLADVKSQVEKPAATAIQDLVDSHPGAPPWRQIVLAGPVGSGRTPLLTGLGTDLAFKGFKVRYIPFDSLLEINDQYRPDKPLPPIGAWGPKNIFYWPWFEAQVVLIDNVSQVVGAGITARPNSDLGTTLNQGLSLIREDLCNRHSVWVFGLEDPDDEATCAARLDEYATNVRAFCKGVEPPIIVRLGAATERME